MRHVHAEMKRDRLIVYTPYAASRAAVAAGGFLLCDPAAVRSLEPVTSRVTRRPRARLAQSHNSIIDKTGEARRRRVTRDPTGSNGPCSVTHRIATFDQARSGRLAPIARSARAPPIGGWCAMKPRTTG